MKVNLTFTEQESEYGLGFTDDVGFLIAFESGIEPPSYSGPYTVTPSRQTQVLQTAGKKLSEQITVNPIPRNYGLITYNGFEITVS